MHGPKCLSGSIIACRHAAARIDRGPAGRHGGVGGQAACRPSGCAGGGGAHLRAAGGLFSALLLHPRRDRKSLSYTEGIRVSGLDFGFPCPYGALESYLKDGCRAMTRDPGDVRLAGSKCGGAVFGQWRYATWGGLLAAVGAHAC